MEIVDNAAQPVAKSPEAVTVTAQDVGTVEEAGVAPAETTGAVAPELGSGIPAMPEMPASVSSDEDDDDDSSDDGSNRKPRLTPPAGGFTEVPPEWNSEEYLSLRIGDFADPNLFYVWKDGQYVLEIQAIEEKRKSLKYKAELQAQFGSSADGTKKVRAIAKAQSELKSLFQDSSLPDDFMITLLREAGVPNPEAVLAARNQNLEAAAQAEQAEAATVA